MSRIGVVTDSNSGILPAEAEKLGIYVLPMPFYIDGKCFLENVDLSREVFFQKLAAGADIATSSPAPLSLTELWDEALAEFDEILYIPMSSGLSSSCEIAMALSREADYAGRVWVVDNGRVSAPQHRSVLDAIELLEQGCSAPRAKELLEQSKGDMTIYVALDELKHLARGGRISSTSAVLGSILNMKPVMQFDIGKLNLRVKCRGKKRARHTMIDLMHEEMDGKFKAALERGDLYLMAAGSASQAETEDWLQQLAESFPGMPILYDDLPLSLCAHIGYGGLGVACSCRVRP